jgi:hypothetical protein
LRWATGERVDPDDSIERYRFKDLQPSPDDVHHFALCANTGAGWYAAVESSYMSYGTDPGEVDPALMLTENDYQVTLSISGVDVAKPLEVDGHLYRDHHDLMLFRFWTDRR